MLALVVLSLVGGVAFYGWVDPARDPLPRCPFYLLTGLHCPGCGAQRSLHAISHGHVTEALRQNLLIVLSLPLLAYYLLRRGLKREDWQPIPFQSWSRPLLGFALAYAVLRNVSSFSFLAPW
jgi:Protein of unknown function (DUF2752)